jgi:hypothetical protein
VSPPASAVILSPRGKQRDGSPQALAAASLSAHPSAGRTAAHCASARHSWPLRIASACRRPTRATSTKSTPTATPAGAATAAARPWVWDRDVAQASRPSPDAARTAATARSAASRSAAQRRSFSSAAVSGTHLAKPSQTSSATGDDALDSLFGGRLRLDRRHAPHGGTAGGEEKEERKQDERDRTLQGSEHGSSRFGAAPVRPRTWLADRSERSVGQGCLYPIALAAIRPESGHRTRAGWSARRRSRPRTCRSPTSPEGCRTRGKGRRCWSSGGDSGPSAIRRDLVRAQGEI